MDNETNESNTLPFSHRDSLLKISLFLFSVSILLIGDFSSFKTGMYIASYQIIFILLYFFSGLKNKKSISVVKNKNNKLITAGVILLYLAYIVSYATNLININSETHKLAMSLRVLFLSTHLFFLYTLLQYFYKSNRFYSYFYAAPMAVVTIIFSILSIYTIFSSPQIHYTTTNIPFATNIRHLGYIATLGAVIATVKVMRNLNFSHTNVAVWLLLLISNVSLLFWLGGRAALLSYVVTIMIYSYLLHRKSLLSKVSVFYISLAITLALLISSWVSIYPWNGILRVKDSLEQANNVNQLSSNRLEMWANCISYGLEKFWLGHGPDAYRFMPTKTAGVQPHNLFLQVFLEAGFVGLVSFSVILITSVYKATLLLVNKVCSEQEEAVSLAFVVIVAMTIHGTLSGTYYHAQPMYFIMMSFAVIASISIQDQNNKNH